MALELAFLSIALMLGLAATITTILALVRNRPRSEADINVAPAETATDMLPYLEDARLSVDIVGGELSPFSSPEVAKALLRRLRSSEGLRIRILGGPEVQANADGRHETYEAWKKCSHEFDGRFQMRFVSGWPATHFTIIDDEILILEQPHPPYYWPRSPDENPVPAGIRLENRTWHTARSAHFRGFRPDP